MNAVSIDVDMLEQMPAKTMLKLMEVSQAASKRAALHQKTVAEFSPLFRRLEELDINLQFSLEDDYIALSFTGDGERLKSVWVELRRHGYEPDSRPTPGSTQFYAFWNLSGFSRLFMNFTSSVCRRVQVGTRTVEQPIYEVRCGELPELEGPSNAVSTVNEVPF